LRPRVGQSSAASDREVGFGAAVDDLEVKAEFVAHTPNERRAIGG
jgi:hypothetical protein